MGSPEKPLDVEMGDMSEESKLKPVDVEVKPDQNLLKKGDEVEETEQRFTGLKKEELLAISNQPKWVRARWALFIIFWIIWIAMLVGAILIVVNAPRCKPEPKQQWYQDNVVYEVNPDQFAGGFKGLEERFSYIKNKLHSGIVLFSGLTANTNDEKVFDDVVEYVHKAGGKVMVDVAVDSMSVDSDNFKQSASAGCALSASTGPNCTMFIWKQGTTSDANSEWKFASDRGELYKVVQDDDRRALLNYLESHVTVYIQDVMQNWFDRGVDGLKIRDVSKLQNVTQKDFVDAVWEKFFQGNNTDRALYVYASTPDASLNPVEFETNSTNTMHSPVYLTDVISKYVNQTNAGQLIEEAIVAWRSQSRAVGGYLVSPLDKDLAAARYGDHAAGMNLLSMALPGLPILRSGDELVATTPIFTWSQVEIRDSIPLNGSSKVLEQTAQLIVRRVEGIQAKQSLRYDTRDNDTVFVFLKTGNPNIVAFKRKWDQKSAVLVVSNMSPVEHIVNLAIDNGLMDEGSFAEEGKILVNSLPDQGTDTLKLKSVKLEPGQTLVLES